MKISPRLFTLTALLAASAFATPLRAADKFSWYNLQSDIHGVAPRTDGNLVNPWGLAPLHDRGIWVANNGTGTLTKYDALGRPLPRPPDPAALVAVPSLT